MKLFRIIGVFLIELTKSIYKLLFANKSIPVSFNTLYVFDCDKWNHQCKKLSLALIFGF